MAKKMLILYYSWSNGNTEAIAEALRKETGADIERIQTAQPYEGSYEEVVAEGKRQTEHGEKPALAPLAHRPEDYDVIAVGTPTWWYTMAPAVLTLLSEHGWSGKTVIPFQTHAGWPGHALEDMARAARGAQVACPIQVQFDEEGGAQQVTAEADVAAWAAKAAALRSE